MKQTLIELKKEVDNSTTMDYYRVLEILASLSAFVRKVKTKIQKTYILPFSSIK